MNQTFQYCLVLVFDSTAKYTSVFTVEKKSKVQTDF